MQVQYKTEMVEWLSHGPGMDMDGGLATNILQKSIHTHTCTKDIGKDYSGQVH